MKDKLQTLGGMILLTVLVSGFYFGYVKDDSEVKASEPKTEVKVTEQKKEVKSVKVDDKEDSKKAFKQSMRTNLELLKVDITGYDVTTLAKTMHKDFAGKNMNATVVWFEQGSTVDLASKQIEGYVTAINGALQTNNYTELTNTLDSFTQEYETIKESLK